MRILRILPLVAVVALAGCLLTSGQITVSYDLDPNPVDVAAPALVPVPVDLNTIDEYNDHKDKIETLADIALLGEITNTGGSTGSLELYMTPANTLYTTTAQLAADASRVLVWGTLSLAPGESRHVDWDESAGLFKGLDLLLAEVKGDGQFTLYMVGTAGATARIRDGVLVIVLDGGQ